MHLGNLREILEIPPKSRTPAHLKSLKEATSSLGVFQKITEAFPSEDVHKSFCTYLQVEDHKEGETIEMFGVRPSKLYILLRGEAILGSPRTKRCDQPLHSSIAVGSFYRAELPTENLSLLSSRPKAAESPEFTEERRLVSLFYSEVDKEKRFFSRFLKENTGRTPECMEVLELLKPNSVYGEAFLFDDVPGSSSLVSLTDTEWAVIDIAQFRRITELLIKKLMNQIIDFLNALPMYRMWTRQSLSKLVLCLKPIDFTRKQFVYQEGDFANALYFVYSGEFALSKQVLQNTKKLVQEPKPKKKQLTNDKALVLSYGREIVRHTNMQMVIKGKNEILGIEALMASSDCRLYSCQCTASGRVYEISREDFLMKSGPPENWEIIRSRMNPPEEKHEVVERLTPSKKRRHSADLIRLLFEKKPQKIVPLFHKRVERRPVSPDQLLQKRKMSADPPKTLPNGLYATQAGQNRVGAPPNFYFGFRKKQR